MTGAPMPLGADAIVMVERTTALDGGRRVSVSVAAKEGDHVRPAGEDMRPGQVVFESGTMLGPGHLGVLASIGCRSVAVRPRPRSACFPPATNWSAGGGPLRPGQIRDSNRITLLALVGQSGFQPVDLGICPDDEVS